MRYAIYFSPSEQSAVWRAGCQWLGRDPVRLHILSQPDVPGMEKSMLIALTQRPRRYGFHATLKPPFRLAAGETAEALYALLSEFASSRKAFRLPPLEIGNLGGFWALRTAQPCAELKRLAEDCVSRFDRFRRPPTRSELARRGRGLDDRQRFLLARWGYPYVMDQWRFHMTLTGPVDAPQAKIVGGFLSGWFEKALQEPLWIEDLCVFVETQTGGEFHLGARFPMAQAV